MVDSKITAANGTGANIGFESTLWQAADKLRGHLDAADYKHVVLGLICLRYISEAFEELYQQLDSEAREDRDEYLSRNVFWMPDGARWKDIQAAAKKPDAGVLIDKALEDIERQNKSLIGVLPKNYARFAINSDRLGELIDLVGSIGLGDRESRAQDILGRVYEYFLGRFASAEGKNGGQFYTPQSVVRLLVEMLEPFHGRIYDPCCGSGGMFVQSERFVETHGGKQTDLSIYGQESNPTTWRLCKMNLAIRGIEGNLGDQAADTFQSDLHAGIQADYILANPPFNIKEWAGASKRGKDYWPYGDPPERNANFGWVQHIIKHLAPQGYAGFVLANGSMSSSQSGEGEIRKAIAEADLVDCMVALPGQLFYSTPISACLWFLTQSKAGNGKYRDRRGQTLFIDARKLATLVDRTHRELSDSEIARIARTYHAWRGEADAGTYEDIPGFCKSATMEEIKGHDYVLTPGRYAGAEDAEEDGEPFEVKIARLTSTLEQQFMESARLEEAIRTNMKGLRYVG